MTLKGYILPSTRAKIKVFFILFGCSACGILVPWLGIKPMPPAGQVWRPNQWKWKSLHHVWFFVTPWTIQSLEFSRPEYWSGQPFPSPGDLCNPGTEPRSPALQADSLPSEPQGRPKNTGVGSLSFLQRIFPIQELNQDLLHCRQILYQQEMHKIFFFDHSQ